MKYKLHITLIFILMLIITKSNALETKYTWINKSDDIFKGKCYEIDTKTSGKAYIAKVRNSLCRPSDTSFYFLYEKSSCYEIDNPTKGRLYLEKVSSSACKTKNTSKYKGVINKNYGCFEIDTESRGTKYFKRIKDNNCAEIENDKYFVLRNETNGDCFLQSINQKKKKIPTKECRTKNTDYVFKKTNFFKGKCFEVDTRGSKYYINKVALKKCKPNKTKFVFLKHKELIGKCFEIDTKTSGQEFISATDLKNCK